MVAQGNLSKIFRYKLRIASSHIESKTAMFFASVALPVAK
jgi:hypothetical protein